VSVSPNSALTAQSVTVTITGSGTHFVNGTTKANFGPGISIGSGLEGSFGPVNVTSATTATAQVSVANNAALGVRTISVQTGTEQPSLINGFTVNGTASLASLNPSSASPGQTVTVTITGAFTHFVNGTSVANFGVGTSVGGATAGAFGPITVTSATTAVASVAIAANATPGLRAPVTVTTGTELASTPSGGGFLVLGPVTGAAPVVTITSPVEAAEVTAVTTVTGMAVSPNLANWTLSYQGSGSTTFTQFATGTTSTVTGTFDPTNLLNGLAQIQLTATDQSGQTSSTITNVAVTRNLKIGNFSLAFTDLSVPVAGIPIQVIRSYDSRRKYVGDFGYGWSLDIDTMKIEANAQIGINWTGILSGFEYCIEPAQNYLVTVRLPNGTEYQFTPTITAATNCTEFQPPEAVDIAFVPTGNTPQNATLTQAGSIQLYVSGNFPGQVQLLDGSDQTFVYDPDQYTLTLPTGQQFVLSRTFGAQSITDTNGNTLTISSTGISSSNGKSVVFTRDGQNRISSITDPNGHSLQYVYSASGDLNTVTDQLGNVSTFTYDGSHDLISYKDPNGNQPMRSVFDDSGRLIQIIDAQGHITNIMSDSAANTETVYDFLGNPTTYVYDSDGNVLSVTDALGDTVNSTYDANDNLTSVTDPLGNKTTFTYDANNNPITQTDALGHTVKHTYNTNDQPLTITDANGNVTTNVYDGSGNLLTTTDALGHSVARTFSGGLITSMTDPTGATTMYTYDSFGNSASKTDASGVVTSYTSDANGNRLSQSVTRTTSNGPQTLVTRFQYDASSRLVSTTYPDGTTSGTTYSATGQDAADTDPLGRTTSRTFDAQSHLLQILYPDGSQILNSYDANARRTQMTSAAGVVMNFTFDAAGRQTSETNVQTGGTSSNTYDAYGNILSTTDELGNVTTFAYDAANRRTSITNALHQVTTFGYDANGNQTSITDANGHTTTTQFDAANRPIKVTYPDGTSATTTYDAAGRIISTTDANGKTTQRAFDVRGLLASVTDALGNVTSYTYDEVGNRITQKDANGHVTTFAYDPLGRRLSRNLPGGQTETISYDAAGNATSRTDFNGKVTTYTYDAVNRVLSKIPDASFHAPTVAFTYNPGGNRATMTDASGVTSYQYDSASRLIQAAKPNGALSYTYDAASNLLSVSGPADVTYTYDALNRLASVSEPNTGTSTYSYDATGNLSAITYPNGVTHAFTYNSKNQLTNLGVNKGATAVASYGYTLDNVGNRTSVAELSGRTVNYVYDSIYRLLSETVAHATAGPNGAVTYAYDAVANRTQATSTLAGISSGTFSYNSDDRLSTDTYDAEGNTIASGGISYTYDFENHLIQKGGVTVVYDGDGTRVAKTVGGVTTKYLVDDFNLTGFPQVVSESISDGSTRTLVYGLSRISQRQFIASSSTTVVSYFVYDGHGSVRALTSASGAVTDEYDYDAFGNLINSSGATPNEFRFGGEQFDSDLNLYYNRARYLNTATGRFLTMDTFQGDPQSPISLHKYLYAGANPVSYIDPSGHDFMEIITSLAIDAALGSIVSFSLGVTGNVFGLVVSALIPTGTWQEAITFPTTGLAGFSLSGTYGEGGLGLTGGGGLEFLYGPQTGNGALFAYVGGAFLIGGTQGVGAALSGYLGLTFRTTSTGDYAGAGNTFSFPSSAVPPAVLQSFFARLPAFLVLNVGLRSWVSTGGFKSILKVVDKLNALENKVTDLVKGSANLGISWGYPNPVSLSFAVGGTVGKPSNSIALGAAYYWLRYPLNDVPFTK
jgi:RHS repeat-associated protein